MSNNANCSTFIVGKKASVTGKVIFAHNEDDMNSIVQVHLVPRMQHQAGETLVFDDGHAVIPQVAETWAYYWSEIRCPGGEPFGDGFVNEWGLVVASNSCYGSKKPAGGVPEAGLGYGLRRLVAERAKTAREAVEVAAALVEQFGYRSARSYQFADKDEAWVFQIPTGFNYVAQRIGDDEVYYMPNWYTIHHIDFTDIAHKKFYFSKNLVSYAQENGWYSPRGKAGDFSDFDFAAVYHDKDAKPFNVQRSTLAWRFISGPAGQPDRTFSIPAPRQFTLADAKKLLRSHYDGFAGHVVSSPADQPLRVGLCLEITVESSVIEFNDDPALTCVWRTSGRPCSSPFVPWYLGISQVPAGYEWTNTLSSQRSHLSPDPVEFTYQPDMAYWAFHLLQNLLPMNYAAFNAIVEPALAGLEADWAATKPAIDQAYRELKKIDAQAARKLLTDYTASQAQRAWDWARHLVMDLVNAYNKPVLEEWQHKL